MKIQYTHSERGIRHGTFMDYLLAVHKTEAEFFAELVESLPYLQGLSFDGFLNWVKRKLLNIVTVDLEHVPRPWMDVDDASRQGDHSVVVVDLDSVDDDEWREIRDAAEAYYLKLVMGVE